MLALRAGALPRGIVPLLVGERSVWRAAGLRPGEAATRDTGLGLRAPRPGRPGSRCGAASAAAFEESLRLIARGLAGGVVTGPVSKGGWARAGYPWADHTARLSACGAGAEMLLGAPSRGLWCALATRHIPLREAPRRAGPAAILPAARALDGALRRLGLPRPRLGLCGLNPHAGEGGLIGREELRSIGPAAAAARREGLRLEGPLPADSAWRLHAEGRLDGLVCLYHDQALIGLKALAGLSGVNWTAGLPFVRVSPAHGTAYEAAAAGTVDPAGTIEAVRLAVRLLAPGS